MSNGTPEVIEFDSVINRETSLESGLHKQEAIISTINRQNTMASELMRSLLLDSYYDLEEAVTISPEEREEMMLFYGLGQHPRVIDLTVFSWDLMGFIGGFTDGRYGYFVPDFFGTVARIDLTDFTTIAKLDLALTDPDLINFWGGFTDGRYGYFVPFGDGLTYSGKIARVDLVDFSTVAILDLTLTDSDLMGFSGGFTDGRYGYFVPADNGVASGDSYFGKIARVDLVDFSTVSVLDLTLTDPDLKGFLGGFTDGRYGYFVPYDNGDKFGKVVRVDLNDFASITVLDLSLTDPDLKGFYGGFADEDYAYFSPYGGIHGKIARVNSDDFATVTVLDLTLTDPDFKSFTSGFTDGRYGYFCPYRYGALKSGKVVRVDLKDFSTVSVADLELTDPDLKGFHGGFTDGKYGYFCPFNADGKVPRIQMFFGGNL